mmetsp:Transcript_1439/g.2660  ORF Transcript_1439/g.2660 Transcript_1439/m.2660 type:complete len:113 (+) Transcript_1439:72-410(+)
MVCSFGVGRTQGARCGVAGLRLGKNLFCWAVRISPQTQLGSNRVGRRLVEHLSSWGATPEWVKDEQATVEGDFNSDHSPVSVNIKGFNIGCTTTARFRRHWAKANWEVIKRR